jgi:endonuclease YncB( thermonuclease family)
VPQGSHFGRSAQPYAAEALAWLKENVEGRRIKCQLLRRDQYNRVVALPLLPHAAFRLWRRWGTSARTTTRNLPLEMVRAGWGAVYVQKGAEYGSDWEKEAYLAAEAEAQSVPFFFSSLIRSALLGPFTGLLALLIWVQGCAQGHVEEWHGHRAALGL